MSLDLNKLENKLDEVLSNETSETLNKFLNDKRMTNNKQQTAVDILCGKLAMKLGIPQAITFYIDHQDEIREAKEMEKEREKSIFSIAYRMTPIEFGKEYCELEFEKFNKTFKQQEQ
jgi:putative protein kinase ArgK-like GTPase of G3E family